MYGFDHRGLECITDPLAAVRNCCKQRAAGEAVETLKANGITFQTFPDTDKKAWKAANPDFFAAFIEAQEKAGNGAAAASASSPSRSESRSIRFASGTRYSSTPWLAGENILLVVMDNNETEPPPLAAAPGYSDYRVKSLLLEALNMIMPPYQDQALVRVVRAGPVGIELLRRYNASAQQCRHDSHQRKDDVSRRDKTLRYEGDPCRPRAYPVIRNSSFGLSPSSLHRLDAARVSSGLTVTLRPPQAEQTRRLPASGTGLSIAAGVRETSTTAHVLQDLRNDRVTDNAAVPKAARLYMWKKLSLLPSGSRKYPA